MKINITANSQTPKYIQIKNQIRDKIIGGELLDGTMLPSERKLAQNIGVHRNTIIKAYSELKADALIQSRLGQGYKVTYKDHFQHDFDFDPKINQEAFIPWEFLMREEIQRSSNRFDRLFLQSYSKTGISFAGGIVPEETYFKEDIKRILNEIIVSNGDEIYKHAPYSGLSELRKNISGYLSGKGINAKSSEIQILAETNHAFDYLIELFINPGDVVLAEEPCSPDLSLALAMSKAKVIPLILDKNGIVTESLDSIIKRNKPKLIFVSASYQDPTGIATSQERRKQILKTANIYRIPIIEDDTASSLTYDDEQIVTFKQLDKRSSVIYIYSFALTFPPGLKVAFILAPGVVTKQLNHAVSVHMVGMDSLTQKIISKYIESGKYEKNIEQIKLCYKEKRDIMCEALLPSKELGVEYEIPKGGVYVWCKLPPSIRPARLLTRSKEKGISFMPGKMFYQRGTKGDSYIRLNYSYPQPEKIKEGVALLIKAMKESQM